MSILKIKDNGNQWINIPTIKGDKGDIGATGSQGPKGDTGADGFSPVATVSKSGKVATITITDKNGTTTAQISDGEDGSEGSGTVESVNGRTGVVTGLIDAPSSPVTGAFLVWNGSAWVAQVLTDADSTSYGGTS